MSRLAATQVPKPADEQAFERASIVLWKGLLKDPNVQRVGRRGQRQNGVDLYGRRDRDPRQLVGIQCKLKGDGRLLDEAEVRDEVSKALSFKPPLREFFIITTAPDSTSLQELARTLTLEQSQAGRQLEINVWGWGTLEEWIGDDADAHQAFDPSFTSFGARLSGGVAEIQVSLTEFSESQTQSSSEANRKLDVLLSRIPDPQVADDTRREAVEAVLDRQIDDIRDLIHKGSAAIAQQQFERLLARIEGEASGRIRFRIEANIGACRLALGDETGAAERLIAAYDFAPSEPKAIVNKVLGLLLRGDWQAARDAGRVALLGGQDDANLASYFVQAGRFDESIDDPLLDVPPTLRSSREVQTAAVVFRRHRDEPDWRDAARALAKTFSDDRYALQMAAEAELEECLQDSSFQERRQVPSSLRQRVRKAVDVLSDLWKKAKEDPETRSDTAQTLCVNRIVGLFALEDWTAALQAAEEGVSAFPEDPVILRSAATVGLEAGAEDLVKRLIPKISADPEGAFVALRFHANRGEWSEIVAVLAAAAKGAPASELAMVEAIGDVAKLMVAGTDLNTGLHELLAGVHEDPRAAIIIAGVARSSRLPDLATAAYEKARTLLGPDSHGARRAMVAHYAARVEEWSVVADALDGWIDTSVDSEELQLLAHAYVSETPARRRGRKFFESLPAPVASLPWYSQAAGLFHFNRGAFDMAETALRRATGEGQLLATLALLETLRRLQREDEIGPIVEVIDPRNLKGSARDQMRFAQAMRRYGDPRAAISFAYDVLQASPDQPDVVLGYVGLIVEGTSEDLIPEADRVDVGHWIDLKADDDTSVQYLIVSSDPRPSDGRVTPENALVAEAMGLPVGGQFTVDGGPAGDRTWRVEAIKHRYLHAFHDITENFETRFPGHPGFWRITMRDDDITPALDAIRRVGEADQARLEVYFERGLPMSMVAVGLPAGTIGLADRIRHANRDIETAVGLVQERHAAAEVIETMRGRGVVLDTYTAWTVMTMEAVDVVKSVFGEIFVAQSSIDDLREVRDRFQSKGGELMTIGWSSGQFTRQILTAEEATQQWQLIDGMIDRLVRESTVAPVEAPDTLTPIEELIATGFSSDVLDPAYLAADRVLLSEDRFYRDAVRQVLRVNSVWLQPVLIWARDQGSITHEEYAGFLVKLAHRQHGHIGVDVASFVTVLREDQSPDIRDFAQVARYIGGPKAEMVGHLSIVSRLINFIWADRNLPPLKVMRATSVLLDAITRERSRPWAKVLAALNLDLASPPSNFLWGWVHGHFLPVSEFQQAEAELRSMQGLSLREAIRNFGRRDVHPFDRRP